MKKVVLAVLLCTVMPLLAPGAVVDFSKEWRITTKRNPNDRFSYALTATLASNIDGTFDDNSIIEFTWEAATGNWHHYNVYASINDADFILVGTTTTTPTIEWPYALPIVIPFGAKVVIQTEAVNVDNMVHDQHVGPMSEPSDPVWRVR